MMGTLTGLMKIKVRDDRFSYLADIIGPGGLTFDEDDVIANNDDEDLQKDPVSQIDLRAHVTSFIRKSAARDAGGFGPLVDQLSAEMIVVRRALQEQSETSGLVDIDNLDYSRKLHS